ncbi:MAG: hypothetical protein QXQ46_09780 [Thermoplasmatales archaeon]
MILQENRLSREKKPRLRMVVTAGTRFLIMSSIIARVETSTMLQGYISNKIGNNLPLSRQGKG